jgi:M6 family metalloprotease-like protein
MSGDLGRAFASRTRDGRDPPKPCAVRAEARAGRSIVSRSRPSIRMALGVAALLLVLFALPAVASALEPPRPGELEQYAKDGTLAKREAFAQSLGNNRLSPAFVQRLKTERFFSQIGASGIAYLPPPAWRGMPTTGNVKILALCIDFSDWPAQNTTGTINSKLFGEGTSAGDYPYESLKNYYLRSSYNQLTIGGNTLGWYRPGVARSAIAQTRAGREALIKEALNSYNAAGHDFSQYDNDGDGVIDYFVVVWAGPDNGWANFWWGYQTNFVDSSYKLDGKSLNTYSWQWECRYSSGTPVTGVYDQIVVMHETGHALGLPDYYDYDDTVGPDGGAGGLDMMDSNWGDHNGFSKWMLGWITPQVVTTAPHSVTLAASGTSAAAMVVMPGASPGNPFAEFYMVQNRQRVGNDSDCANIPYQDMPNDGLVIWHVDARLEATNTDFAWDNSYTAHKLLRLMEADGLEQIEATSGTSTWPYGYAEAGDYYTSGKTFGDATAPNSKRYDGSATGVAVSGIPAAGSSMSFTAGIVGASPPGSDVTAPVTTMSGVTDGGVYKTDITIQLDAVDEAGGSGVANITGIVNGGVPSVIAGNQAFLNIPADPTHVYDGTYTLQYFAADNASNFETPKSVTATMDTYGPVTKAPYSARVQRLRSVKLYFRVLDPVWGTTTARPGEQTGYAGLKIKKLNGHVVRSVTFGPLDIGQLYYWQYKAKLAKGTYRFYIYARDDVLNNQRSVGKNKLVIH